MSSETLVKFLVAFVGAPILMALAMLCIMFILTRGEGDGE